MIPRYGRPVPQYSIISSLILDDLYTRFSYLLESFDLPFLQSHMLEMYCRAIYNKGAAFLNVRLSCYNSRKKYTRKKNKKYQ